MHDNALKKLSGRSITNWHPSHKENNGYIYKIPFFSSDPMGNYLYQHIQIYKLIQEYVELFEDCQKMNSSGKKYLEDRMKEIEDKLLCEYWIVSKSQTKPDKWICCDYDS